MGERTDPSYWRVYDKGVESGAAPAGHLWRIELEAKRGLAPKIAEEACRSRDVPSWCEQRLRSSWKSAGYSWPLPERGALLPPVKPDAAPPPDALRLLLWYQQSVAPTIPKVLTVFTVSELLDALGLAGRAISRPPDDADLPS